MYFKLEHWYTWRFRAYNIIIMLKGIDNILKLIVIDRSVVFFQSGPVIYEIPCYTKLIQYTRIFAYVASPNILKYQYIRTILNTVLQETEYSKLVLRSLSH